MQHVAASEQHAARGEIKHKSGLNHQARGATEQHTTCREKERERDETIETSDRLHDTARSMWTAEQCRLTGDETVFVLQCSTSDAHK